MSVITFEVGEFDPGFVDGNPSIEFDREIWQPEGVLKVTETLLTGKTLPLDGTGVYVTAAITWVAIVYAKLPKPVRKVIIEPVEDAAVRELT